ncbi:MAG: alpha/beta fold hydrolase [Hyphomicrobiales bacterium]|nr:alpha/beta fold hydrolase [Hyphomicrobiales bacterium]
MNLEIVSREATTPKYSTPLLFVHGAWHGAWCWDEYFLPYFAERGFSAHAVSLRNHGGSERSGGLRWKRIGDYVADVEQAANSLPRPPAIIGHSMGGFVTQHYLARNAAPAGVLLASVPPHGVFGTTLKLARRHPLAFAKANATWSLYPFVATPALAREAFFSSGVSDMDVARYQSRLQDESWFAFLDMLVFDLPRAGAKRSPMLVVGGADDTIFSPRDVEATARAYDVQAEIVDGLAHDIMLEPRWRAVASRIAGWLETVLT